MNSPWTAASQQALSAPSDEERGRGGEPPPDLCESSESSSSSRSTNDDDDNVTSSIATTSSRRSKAPDKKNITLIYSPRRGPRLERSVSRRCPTIAAAARSDHHAHPHSYSYIRTTTTTKRPYQFGYGYNLYMKSLVEEAAAPVKEQQKQQHQDSSPDQNDSHGRDRERESLVISNGAKEQRTNKQVTWANDRDYYETNRHERTASSCRRELEEHNKPKKAAACEHVQGAPKAVAGNNNSSAVMRILSAVQPKLPFLQPAADEKASNKQETTPTQTSIVSYSPDNANGCEEEPRTALGTEFENGCCVDWTNSMGCISWWSYLQGLLLWVKKNETSDEIKEGITNDVMQEREETTTTTTTELVLVDGTTTIMMMHQVDDDDDDDDDDNKSLATTRTTKCHPNIYHCDACNICSSSSSSETSCDGAHRDHYASFIENVSEGCTFSKMLACGDAQEIVTTAFQTTAEVCFEPTTATTATTNRPQKKQLQDAATQTEPSSEGEELNTTFL